MNDLLNSLQSKFTSKNLTYVGIAMIAVGVGQAAIALFDGDPATNVDWKQTFAIIGTGFGFVMGKGAASTGGTVAETPEAAKRLASPPKGFGRIGLLTAMALVASLIVVAAPRVACADGWLVHCVSGCAEKAPLKMKAGLDGAEVQVAPTLWFGPSVNLTPYVFDVANQKWEQDWSPEFAYGLKWRPLNWTATSSALAFDLAGKANFGDLSHIDLLPSVTFLDSVKIGYGPRFHFPGGGQRFAVSQLISFGISRSFGGP